MQYVLIIISMTATKHSDYVSPPNPDANISAQKKVKNVVEKLLKEVRVISLCVCGVYKAIRSDGVFVGSVIRDSVPVWAGHQLK